VSWLREASEKTPDPTRSLNNLKTFLQLNPDRENDLKAHIDYIANLFACSQFLANFSIKNPSMLFKPLDSLMEIGSKREMSDYLGAQVTGKKYAEALSIFRKFKKEVMIGITVRDVMGLSDTVESMDQMSDLADAIILVALDFVRNEIRAKHGIPADDSFAVFALGKLGAQELNYSSDVDLIFVYGNERGVTSGIKSPTGATINTGTGQVPFTEHRGRICVSCGHEIAPRRATRRHGALDQKL
jgi:glutamate-ammonia-ligase adenylyltransferase